MSDSKEKTKMDTAPVPSSSSCIDGHGTAEQGIPQKGAAVKTDTGKGRPAVAMFPIFLFVDNTKGSEEQEIIKRRLIIDGDGAGDDKRLTKLAETYLKLVDNISDEETSAIHDAITFKALLKQTDGIRSSVAKTYNAVVANAKGVTYWNLIQDAIAKEIAELKTIVFAVREKLADMKRNRKESQEREALVKLLDKVSERDSTAKDLEKLKEEYQELQRRQAELDEQITNKKAYLSYLCDLVKRLDNEEVQVVEDAIVEAEEKVLSDISMDLE